MPLALTSSGKVYHRDFTVDQSCPAWLTESVAGTGAISYNANGALLNADGDSSGAILVSTNNVNGQTYVFRTKGQKSNSTASRTVILSGIWDKAAPRPTVTAAIESWDEPYIAFTRSAGGVESIYTRDGAGDLYLLNPATTLTDYVADIRIDGGRHTSYLRSATDYSFIANDRNAVSHAGDIWFWCGDQRSAAGSGFRGPLLVKYIQWFKSFAITVTGLPTGAAVRLFDNSGNLVASAEEGEPDAMASYTIKAHATEGDRAPKDWTIEGSDDDAAWTVLDTKVDEVFANDEVRSFSMPTATKAYRYYRLNCTENGGDASYLCITEMEFQRNGVDVAPAMTSNVLPVPYVASASSDDGVNLAWKAFNNAVGGGQSWNTVLGTTTGWLKIDTGSIPTGTAGRAILGTGGAPYFNTNSNPNPSDGGFNGKIIVYEDNSYATKLAGLRSTSIWGGDEYAYTAPSSRRRRLAATGMRR